VDRVRRQDAVMSKASCFRFFFTAPAFWAWLPFGEAAAGCGSSAAGCGGGGMEGWR